MADRDELIEAGAQALYPMTGRTDPRHVGDYEHTTAAAVVDAVEPLIRADEREWPVALADGWTAEAARYRGYAEGSSNPAMHRSVAQTLEQCADAVRAAGAGIPEGSRLEAGTETSVQPDAIGPDTRSWAALRAKVLALPKHRFIHSSGRVQWVRLDDVLALLEESPDE
jgi:hypothetical protein